MRKWIGLILTTLLVIIFLPAGCGILAKKSLDHLIADLPMPEGMTLSLKEYTFGWLSSYAAINIHIEKTPQRAQYMAGDTMDIVIHGNMAHGPLMLTKRGIRPGIARLDTHANAKDFHGLNEKTQQELDLLFKDNDLLFASSLFQFLQGIRIDIYSSPIHAQAGQDVLQWGGINGHIKINHDFDQLHTDLIITPVLFTTQEGAIFDMAQAHFVAQMYREEKSIWVGKQVFQLPTLYLKDATGAVLRFDHLHVMSDSNILDELLHASLKIEAEHLELKNQVIDQLRFHIELSDLSSPPLFALSQLMHKKSWSMTDRKEMFKLITQALSTGADIELDYLLHLQDNQVLLRGLLYFPNLSDENEHVASIAQQLLQGLTAHVEFAAPQDTFKELLFNTTSSALTQQMGTLVVEQEMQIKQTIDSKIQNWIDSGVLVANDKNYYLDFDYQQGNMILNTHPISQGDLFLLLMILLQAAPTPNESITH